MRLDHPISNGHHYHCLVEFLLQSIESRYLQHFVWRARSIFSKPICNMMRASSSLETNFSFSTKKKSETADLPLTRGQMQAFFSYTCPFGLSAKSLVLGGWVGLFALFCLLTISTAFVCVLYSLHRLNASVFQSQSSSHPALHHAHLR